MILRHHYNWNASTNRIAVGHLTCGGSHFRGRTRKRGGLYSPERRSWLMLTYSNTSSLETLVCVSFLSTPPLALHLPMHVHLFFPHRCREVMPVATVHRQEVPTCSRPHHWYVSSTCCVEVLATGQFVAASFLVNGKFGGMGSCVSFSGRVWSVCRRRRRRILV